MTESLQLSFISPYFILLGYSLCCDSLFFPFVSVYLEAWTFRTIPSEISLTTGYYVAVTRPTFLSRFP